MRIISLAFAAAVIFGLASSTNAANKVSGTTAHKLLAEGEILHVSQDSTYANKHYFTVSYDNKIYHCGVLGGTEPLEIKCSTTH